MWRYSDLEKKNLANILLKKEVFRFSQMPGKKTSLKAPWALIWKESQRQNVTIRPAARNPQVLTGGSWAVFCPIWNASFRFGFYSAELNLPLSVVSREESFC